MNNNYYSNPFTTGTFNFNNSTPSTGFNNTNLQSSLSSTTFNNSTPSTGFNNTNLQSSLSSSRTFNNSTPSTGFNNTNLQSGASINLNSNTTQQTSITENKENYTNVLADKNESDSNQQFSFLFAEAKINLKNIPVIKKINCERPYIIQKGSKKEIYLKVPGFSRENLDLNLMDQKIVIQGKRTIPMGDEDSEKVYEIFSEEIIVFPETKIEDIVIKTYFGILIIYVEIPNKRLPKKIFFSE